MPRLNVVNGAAIARVNATLRSRLAGTEEARRLSVTVGVHQEEGSEAEGESGATVADVALFHELGTSRAPRRSWLADGIDENERSIAEALRRMGVEIAAGRMRADVAYLQLGEFVVLRLQERIRAGIAPPNAPSTILAKGSSTPLIDEGRLIASIRARLRGADEQ